MREPPRRTVSLTVVPPGTVGSNPTPSALWPLSRTEGGGHSCYRSLLPTCREELSKSVPSALYPERPGPLLGCRSCFCVRRLRLDVAVGHGDAAAGAAGDVFVVGDQDDRDALVVAELTQQSDDVGGRA